ncbi:MAG: hypothetical protein K6E51_03605 [Treponema sp.]|nr:hypothetical protein [Treponema sp.]
MLSFNLGTDLFVSYRIKPHFGFYGNLGLYWLPGGTMKYKNNLGSQTKDLDGKYCITPSLGVIWNF